MQFVAGGIDAEVGAIPTQTRNPRKATGMPALLKVTLLVFAGVLLALALTDAGLVKSEGALQTPQQELSARERV